MPRHYDHHPMDENKKRAQEAARRPSTCNRCEIVERAAMNFQDEEEDYADDEALLFVPRNVTVPEPRQQDVICGRGKSVAHPGNQRLAELIRERKDEYQRANRRDDKTRITFEIVQAMRQGPSPARFLLKDLKTGAWVDVGQVYAREKVSHALRSRPNEERRRKSKPKKKLIRKPQIPPELEGRVQSLIEAQQQLLKSMIEKEMLPGSQLDPAALKTDAIYY